MSWSFAARRKPAQTSTSRRNSPTGRKRIESGRGVPYDPAARAKKHGFGTTPADVLTYHHRLVFGTDPTAEAARS